MKRVGIVILHYNKQKETIECLKSLSRLNIENFEPLIIVVDNGSEEKLKTKNLRLKNAKAEFIINGENLGFAGGNNVGIRYALEHGADYVLILNNDTIVDKNLVEELLKAMESNSKCGLVSPKVYFEKGYEFHKDRYKKEELGKVIWYAGGLIDWNNVIGYHRGVDEVDYGKYDDFTSTDYATGNCMLVKREVFEKVGLFDEKYFLYYEDLDFNQRVKKKGYEILFAPKAILWHKNAASTGGSGSELQDYYTTRNRLLFGLKYAPLRSKLALFRESLELLTKGRRWQKRGVLDFYLRRFGKGSYDV